MPLTNASIRSAVKLTSLAAVVGTTVFFSTKPVPGSQAAIDNLSGKLNSPSGCSDPKSVPDKQASLALATDVLANVDSKLITGVRPCWTRSWEMAQTYGRVPEVAADATVQAAYDVGSNNLAMVNEVHRPESVSDRTPHNSLDGGSLVLAFGKIPTATTSFIVVRTGNNEPIALNVK